MKKTILVKGPVTTESGYGSHSRQLARWLLEDHRDDEIIIGATPWGNTPWNLDYNSHGGLIGELYKHRTTPSKKPDVSFQIQLPNEWNPEQANFNVGVTAAIETDRCNPLWIDCCNRMNAIVVPSEHAAKSLTNSGHINVPLHIIPESFFDAILDDANHIPTKELTFSTDFNFLLVGQLTANDVDGDRKNIFNTLKWLCEEFKNDKNVGIVLKTNMSRNTKIDRDHTESLMKKLVHEINRGDSPKINLIHGNLSDYEMKSLYLHPQIKSLVSLTRGEGFGLPLLEAAACGLPIIATNWSAHTEFLKLGKFITVNHDLISIPNSRIDNSLFMQGSQWANANEFDFKKKVRKFYQSTQLPKQWANELSLKIKQNYNHVAIKKIYENIFSDILKA